MDYNFSDDLKAIREILGITQAELAEQAAEMAAPQEKQQRTFSDNKKNLKRILNETDFYVGVNGMATYSTLPTPPIERILLETDAPFLTPKPFRGIINEPAYVPAIAEWLAAKLGLDYQIIERETTKNAEQLFHI